MEEGWERPPLVELSDAELSERIEAAFPNAELVRHETISTGLANTNIRFWLRAHVGSYVLRLHTRDPQSAKREAALMRYLAARAPQVPIPELVYADSFTVWRFVNGQLLQDLFNDSRIIDVAESCGRTLAEIHRCRFDFCGSFTNELKLDEPYGAPSDFVPGFIRTALAGLPGQRLGPELSQRLQSAVAPHLPLLQELDGTYTLVHADYKRSNLLIEGDKVSAVLDWEFACAGPPLIDVGIFLRAGRQLPPGFMDAFVRGYCNAGGSLPKQWLRLSRLLDLISQLTFLDGAAERPRVWEETKRVITETIGSLT